jgi:GNAT superfamily N-acetyltransferase
MAHPDLARTLAFAESLDRRQAARVVEVPGGFAVLHPDYAASYDNNKLVLADVADPAVALRAGDRVLGGAGLRHRLVVVHDDAAGQRCASAFVEAGYRHDTNLVMSYQGGPPVPPSTAVTPVDLDTLYELDRRAWRDELPATVPDAAIAQLAARRAAHARAADEVHFLGVRAGGQVRARAELYLDPAAGVGQIEDVLTDPDHRGRGYATAIIMAGLRQALAARCSLNFLVADAVDWPRVFYRRLGYVEIGRIHLFCRPAD